MFDDSVFFKPQPSHVPTHVAAPTVARPTLNDLQPHQHEKVSLVCARAESRRGLALVPCALNAVDKCDRTQRLNHTHPHTLAEKL